MVELPDLIEERALQAQGLARLAGIDEAGRGAWAGPVVAAAVVLPLERPDLIQALGGVRDSKQCTPRQRDELFDRVREAALAVGVGSVPPVRIDEIGIVPATRKAMVQAVSRLEIAPDALLIDALQLPDLPLPQRALIKGDARSLSVAAASIVAKVTRDRMMASLDTRYGGYGFARHKGYGTRGHRQSLALLGPSPVHRLSFAPLKKLTGETDEPVRVLTYNIHRWYGCDGRVDVARVARVIAGTRADIVGLNEVLHLLTAEGMSRDLLSEVAGRLGMAFAFGPTAACSDWGGVAGPYGHGLLSRYPIRSAQTICLPETGEHGRRAVLRAELAVGREIWTAYVTHLNGPGEAVRHGEAAALLEIIARFGDSLHVLMGDFNLQVVPQILAAGYADAWTRAAGGGEGATWPAPSPGVRVDYLFVPPPLQGRLVACRVPDDELARTASDHRSVLAEFQVGPFPKT